MASSGRRRVGQGWAAIHSRGWLLLGAVLPWGAGGTGKEKQLGISAVMGSTSQTAEARSPSLELGQEGEGVARSANPPSLWLSAVDICGFGSPLHNSTHILFGETLLPLMDVGLVGAATGRSSKEDQLNGGVPWRRDRLREAANPGPRVALALSFVTWFSSTFP